MSDFQQTPFVATTAYFYRLELRTPDPDDEKSFAKWMLGMDGDTPEIKVWAAKSKGPIKARLNTTILGILLPTLLVEAISLPPGKKNTLPIEANRTMPDGSRERKIVSHIVAGKRSDGVIVTGLFDVDDSRPRVLFPMINLDWVGKPMINGEVMTEEKVSEITTRWYADFLRQLAITTAKAETEEERKASLDKFKQRQNNSSQRQKEISDFTL